MGVYSVGTSTPPPRLRVGLPTGHAPRPHSCEHSHPQRHAIMGTTHTRETFSHTLILSDTSPHSGMQTHTRRPAHTWETRGGTRDAHPRSLSPSRTGRHTKLRSTPKSRYHGAHTQTFTSFTHLSVLPPLPPQGDEADPGEHSTASPHSLSTAGTRDPRVASSLSTRAPSTGSQAPGSGQLPGVREASASVAPASCPLMSHLEHQGRPGER